MKIGILTFTDGTNIGQRLQNYALQQTIRQLIPNCEVFTIRQGYPFDPFKRDIKKMLGFLKKPVKGISEYKRSCKFNSFNKQNIQFFSREMPFSADNTSFSEEFDFFIVGSDQVWNPNSPFVGSNFFLTFAKPYQRITYAPSFSVDYLPENKTEIYKQYFEGFSTITVREDVGVEIVERLTNVPAEVVLDPTLLLEKSEYDKIKVTSSKRPKEKYILAMFLGTQPQEDIIMISDKLGTDVLYISPDTAIGPDEFLDIVEHSELVLTDSYHVTIFSIIYHRQFINFTRSGEGASMNSRFETLYRILNIHDRTWEYLRSHFEEICDQNFDETEVLLAKEKKRCREILKKSIDKNTES